MAEYLYGWDSEHHKKVYRGKYPSANSGTGYYGNNDAGQRQEFTPKKWGTNREFIGSRSKEYTFSDTQHGTHTFSAVSYRDALRQAESMGYTASDYKRRSYRKR